MKKAIRVRGWISTANLINPRKLFTDELPRYYLAIQPEDPMVLDENDFTCHLYQRLIPHGDHLTSKCQCWMQRLERKIGLCPEAF